MGLWATMKGWFNIGGVKVKVEGLNPVIAKDGNHISAKVTLSAKSDKHVNRLTYKFLLKRTSGRGEDKKSTEYVLAERVVEEPFDLKTGESKTVDLELDYALEKSLKDMGGVLGGIGKLAAFTSSEKDEYFVIAQADVKGSAVSPSHWVPVTLK